MRLSIVLPLCALVAACGPKPSDPGPGGVTVSEAKALDEAAEMLEHRRTPNTAAATDGAATAPTKREVETR